MKNNRAFNLLELIVVVIIIGILSTMGMVLYNNWRDSEDKKNTRIILKAIQLAEWDYNARTETCSTSWHDLEVGDPNQANRNHAFSIECSPTFLGKGCRKRDPSKCMTIDLYGHITEY